MTDDLMTYLHPAASGELDLLELIDLPYYDKWSPKVAGDTVSGRVEHRRIERWYDKPTEVLYVTGDRNVKIVASGVVLEKQIVAEDPQSGDYVHARFDGQGVSQASGRTYNKFTFVKEA